MKHQEELNQYITDLSKRKPVRKFKSDKGYDRVRDRKDKRLYVEEDDFGTDEERSDVL